MKLFENSNEFDELLATMTENEKRAMLDRYRKVELAHSWLTEKKVKFSLQELMNFVMLIQKRD